MPAVGVHRSGVVAGSRGDLPAWHAPPKRRTSRNRPRLRVSGGHVARINVVRSVQRIENQPRRRGITSPDATTFPAWPVTPASSSRRTACALERKPRPPADTTAFVGCNFLLGSESDRVIRDGRNNASGHRLSGWNEALIPRGGDAASREQDMGISGCSSEDDAAAGTASRCHDLPASGRRHLPGRRVQGPGTTRTSRASRQHAARFTMTSPERDPNPEIRTALQEKRTAQMQCEAAQRTADKQRPQQNTTRQQVAMTAPIIVHHGRAEGPCS